ncbi:hypothetical protein NEHOM01_1784 [Nematocida homosporus]|uniref:uncharacterized protein n=1 Tax=Nematocida homosporus TaxID=1912981 RepID=UPI00221FE934|nr:uncharacterized protein NEHOM01_1784 [Nematocida homosporus]KAI5186895.1 hypothetical protein NEHOM01_1784 [Nematocida homosporus]
MPLLQSEPQVDLLGPLTKEKLFEGINKIRTEHSNIPDDKWQKVVTEVEDFASKHLTKPVIPAPTAPTVISQAMIDNEFALFRPFLTVWYHIRSLFNGQQLDNDVSLLSSWAIVIVVLLVIMAVVVIAGLICKSQYKKRKDAASYPVGQYESGDHYENMPANFLQHIGLHHNRDEQ